MEQWHRKSRNKPNPKHKHNVHKGEIACVKESPFNKRYCTVVIHLEENKITTVLWES